MKLSGFSFPSLLQGRKFRCLQFCSISDLFSKFVSGVLWHDGLNRQSKYVYNSMCTVHTPSSWILHPLQCLCCTQVDGLEEDSNRRGSQCLCRRLPAMSQSAGKTRWWRDSALGEIKYLAATEQIQSPHCLREKMYSFHGSFCAVPVGSSFPPKCLPWGWTSPTYALEWA